MTTGLCKNVLIYDYQLLWQQESQIILFIFLQQNISQEEPKVQDGQITLIPTLFLGQFGWSGCQKMPWAVTASKICCSQGTFSFPLQCLRMYFYQLLYVSTIKLKKVWIETKHAALLKRLLVASSASTWLKQDINIDSLKGSDVHSEKHLLNIHVVWYWFGIDMAWSRGTIVIWS